MKIEEASLLTQIPVTNLRRIESGEIFPKEETEKLADLYQLDEEILFNTEILLPTWKEIRRNVLKKHRNNLFYMQAINKKPRPKKAVKYRLLNTNFMNNYVSVAEAREKIATLYRWRYDEARIDYALNSLVNGGILEKLTQKGQPYKFRKSRSLPQHPWLIPDRIAMELEEITARKITDSLTPAHFKMAGMLLALRKGSETGQNLFKTVLYSYSPKNIERSLKILKKLGLVQQTEKQVNSSKQMYILTDQGRDLLRGIGVEVNG